MTATLSLILLRTVDDKSFIAKEATKAVQTCINNNMCAETLEIVIREGCKNSNKKLSDEAYITFLMEFVVQADFA